MRQTKADSQLQTNTLMPILFTAVLKAFFPFCFVLNNTTAHKKFAMLIQSLQHHYITSWSSHARLYSNLTTIVSCLGEEIVMCTHATSPKVLTSSPPWLWVRTALCSGVRPSLFLKSRWAPPWTSTLMPSTGRPDCTATQSGVSKPQEANIQPSDVCCPSVALQVMKVS